MCGLVGCAGAKLEVIHERAFKDLLIVDTIRGPHSTGIMASTTGGDIVVFKKAVLPTDLFSMYGCQQLFKYHNNVLIGHNRWATQGAINGVNAHPFEFETLVGAHNGTLTNQRLLPDHTKFEVDSENIFHSIEKIGLKDTVSKLHGAYALTWFDKDRQSMNIIRNKERPMFVTFTKDENVMFWASESWMLSGVLQKNGIEHGEVFDTALHTHYEFKIPKYDAVKKEKNKLPKPIQTKVQPWSAPAYPKGRVVPFNKSSKTNGAGAGTTTQAGTNSWDYYDLGEKIYFYLSKSSPTKLPYIYGRLAGTSTKRVKIYAKEGTWLRKNLELDGGDTVCYEGVVNGYYAGGFILQENSVYTVDDDDYDMETDEEKQRDYQVLMDKAEADAKDRDIADAKDMKPEYRLKQIKALQATGGTCSWCGDPITPNRNHIYIDDKTIVCKDCNEKDALAQEFIKSQ